MSQSLPTAILPHLLALGTALVEVAVAAPQRTLADLEAGVRAAVQAALPGLLGAVVQQALPDLDPAIATVRRRCPHCDRLVNWHEGRARTIRTTCGAITVARPWYHCAPCQHGFSPVDAALALPPLARISPALQAWLVRLAVATPPREAAAILTDLTGLIVHPDTLREHTTRVGAALADWEDAASAQVERAREAAEPVDPAPGTLVVETDGAMVRYRDGWHEVKIGVVGEAQQGELTAASYVAAREPAARFGPRLLVEAARRGALEVVRGEGGVRGRALAVLRPVHVLGDGALWIWNLAAENFGERTEAVDFYHAAEHVWTVERAVYGADSEAARVGATVCVRALRACGVEPVRAALAALQPATAEAAAALRTERAYFATNADRMDYPSLVAHGLPIGSGAVESSAKHVVPHRLKRPGQRWSERGGRAMLTLPERAASGRPLTPTR